MQRVTEISPETRIVFLTAGGASNDEKLRMTLSEAVESIDWARVNQLATVQKAAAALSRAFDRIHYQSVPANIFSSLRRQRMVSEFHMLHLRERLQQTIGAFASANVPVMLMKGSAMASSVYNDFAERPMADIDLLVRREDSERALAALRQADWISPNAKEYEAFFSTHHHLEPLIDGRGSKHRIELHVMPFRPPNPFETAEADLWSDATKLVGALDGAHVPRRAHMFVYACIHMAWSHKMTRGAWRTFRDLHGLAAGGVTLAEVVEVARRWKALSSCYWATRLSQTLCAGPSFEKTIDEFSMPHTKISADLLERHLIGELVRGERDTCPSERLSNALWRMAIKPRWSGHGSAVPGDEQVEWPDAAGSHGVPRDHPTLKVRLRSWARFARGLAGA